jgi:hypothetical protein
MSYRFGKTEETQKVEIFVGVKYAEKDLAKQKGAKWDMKDKKWFFSFPLNEFIDNENLHTHQFKPFSVSIPYSYAKENGEVARIQMINNCYQIGKNRNIKYLEELKNQKEEKIEEDIKPKVKEIWPYACTFCKESKLSIKQINALEEDYTFNTDPCTECKTNYNLSKYI